MQTQPVKPHFAGKNFLLAMYGGFIAFVVYTCMYSFRKPYTAATFDGITLLGINYKTSLVILQLLGYTLSKFIGIKFISEIKPEKRFISLLFLMACAAVTLLLFGIVPAPYNAIFMFLNGIPLGMIWGLVFGYLEGRKFTELMGAILASSFIFSSGFVKRIGKWLMTDFDVSHFWMPFYTACLFMIPLIIFSFLLKNFPPPNEEDLQLRSKREPMDGAQRKAFLAAFFWGVFSLVAAYIFLTIIRDFRDNFMADIWQSLGYEKNPEIFTLTETPIAICVLIITAFISFFRNNFKALLLNHYLVIGGFLLAIISSLLFKMGWINPVVWMTATGFGLYIGYVPINCMVFERLIAAFKQKGNIGFLMYLADTFGYLGSILIMLGKEIIPKESVGDWTSFYFYLLIIMSCFGVVFMSSSLFFFIRKNRSLNLITQNESL